MQELTKKAIRGLIWLQIIMALMLFLPAWRVRFWETLILASLLGVVPRSHVAFPET
jgi:hypothetical protein